MKLREEKPAVAVVATTKPQPTSLDLQDLKAIIKDVVVQTLQASKPAEVLEYPVRKEQIPSTPIAAPTGYTNHISSARLSNWNSQQVTATRVQQEKLFQEDYLGKRSDFLVQQAYSPPEYLNDVPFLKMLYDIQTRNVPGSKKTNPFADFSMFAYEIANQVAQSTEIRSFLTNLHAGRQDTVGPRNIRGTEIQRPKNSGFSLVNKSPVQSTTLVETQTGSSADPSKFDSLLDGFKGLHQGRGYQKGDLGDSREPPPVSHSGAQASSETWHWAKRLPDMPRFVETNASVPSARSSAHLGPQK